MQREILYQIVTDQVQRLRRHVIYILKSGHWESFADTATPGTENKGQSQLCLQDILTGKGYSSACQTELPGILCNKAQRAASQCQEKVSQDVGHFHGVLKGTLNAYNYHQGKCLPWCFLPWLFVKLAEGTRNTSGLSCPPLQLTLPVTYDFSKKKKQFFKINLSFQIAFSVTFSYIYFYVYLVYVFTCVGAYKYMSSRGGPRLMLCSFSIAPYLIY